MARSWPKPDIKSWANQWSWKLVSASVKICFRKGLKKKKNNKMLLSSWQHGESMRNNLADTKASEEGRGVGGVPWRKLPPAERRPHRSRLSDRNCCLWRTHTGAGLSWRTVACGEDPLWNGLRRKVHHFPVTIMPHAHTSFYLRLYYPDDTQKPNNHQTQRLNESHCAVNIKFLLLKQTSRRT